MFLKASRIGVQLSLLGDLSACIQTAELAHPIPDINADGIGLAAEAIRLFRLPLRCTAPRSAFAGSGRLADNLLDAP